MGSTFPFVSMGRTGKSSNLRRKGVYGAEPWSGGLEEAGFCS